MVKTRSFISPGFGTVPGRDRRQDRITVANIRASSLASWLMRSNTVGHFKAISLVESFNSDSF